MQNLLPSLFCFFFKTNNKKYRPRRAVPKDSTKITMGVMLEATFMTF
jgi:hypothetical protein